MKTMHRTERGFTLIELMIAMLISLIIAAAAIQLFQNSLNAVTRANEIQRNQQTLLAIVEHLLPRIRQADTVTADPDDASEGGLYISRKASDTAPGHACTGAPLSAGDSVTERYYIDDDDDLWCESTIGSASPTTEIVAFDIAGLALNRSYEDTTDDGRGDVIYESAFPGTQAIVGVELVIEQPLPDGGTRAVPFHVALRNNTLTGRNENEDFE